MIKRLRYFTLPIILLLILVAGDEPYTLEKKISLHADYIRSDELGNVFAIKDNQLTKYNQKGEETHTYSNLYSGDISFIDTHDPFKILLYYPSFGQIQFLDHTLSLSSSRIDLNQLGLGLSTLVCSSYQGAFWVYDPTNFELVRINQSLEVNERSGNLQQVTGLSVDPNYMLERDNTLYLNDPNTGILIFDKYGSYYKTIPVKGLVSFQVFDRKIIYIQQEKIHIYNTKLNEVSTATLPRSVHQSISVCLSTDPQRIYILDDTALYYFKIN
jgi:hypothetical protein